MLFDISSSRTTPIRKHTGPNKEPPLSPGLQRAIPRKRWLGSGGILDAGLRCLRKVRSIHQPKDAGGDCAGEEAFEHMTRRQRKEATLSRIRTAAFKARQWAKRDRRLRIMMRESFVRRIRELNRMHARR